RYRVGRVVSRQRSVVEPLVVLRVQDVTQLAADREAIARGRLPDQHAFTADRHRTRAVVIRAWRIAPGVHTAVAIPITVYACRRVEAAPVVVPKLRLSPER